MNSSKLIQVELHPADSAAVERITLRLNQTGELPVLLVDPLDDSGTAVAGMWLNRDTRETVYHWTKQTPSRRHQDKAPVDETEPNLMGTQ
ncbi:hypothetical protein E3T61_20950 [Cryobacterium lactosi]|uniref:Uncharacterized protein n=1 Tax=Cryobacterium lactosi TaxID=1259202 RepID=A0A4R9BGC9_9MICO|nr:hypothetical protein [Cryobacterium lactosi]TFD83510.1 hypothetical protein E3T61_20950 [Cryobacterium lactosi]